jgi:hypothetical protein
MSETIVRLHYKMADGTIMDAANEYELSDFAGVLPSVGDQMLDPGVRAAKDRARPKNRELLTIVSRVFNPRDNKNYVALICESRPLSAAESALES